MTDSSGGVRQRVDAIDVARGVALLAMAIYHFMWDLHFAGLLTVNVAVDPVGRASAMAIAGTFLSIVGISLVLASPINPRSRSYLKRLAMIVAAASLVTIGTWFMMPDRFVYFGILHSIAVASVLALPFLRAPLALTIVITIVFLVTKEMTGIRLEHPNLVWIGLTDFPRPAVDYVPLFPWFGIVLAGVVAARLALMLRGRAWWAGWKASAHAVNVFAFTGRHSLAFYLIHQPVLIAIAYGLAFVIGPTTATVAIPFIESCQNQCIAGGTNQDICVRRCRCVANELVAGELTGLMTDQTISAQDEARLIAIAQQCRQ